MKLLATFALILLSTIVKAAWWIPAVQPVILSLGAVLTAFNLDVLNIDVQPIEWKNWLSLKKKKDETPLIERKVEGAIVTEKDTKNEEVEYDSKG